ncbi:MAG: hypothetical protein AB8B74_00915 [Crocinitomicaceae bacterium]
MKQVYRFFFLLLAVVFSFGFTNSTSACQGHEQIEHSCCSKKQEDKTPKPCSGDCCVENQTITKLEETEQVEVKNKGKIKPLLSDLGQKTDNNFVWQIKNKGFFAKTKQLKTPGFLSIKTENWLI